MPWRRYASRGFAKSSCSAGVVWPRPRTPTAASWRCARWTASTWFIDPVELDPATRAAYDNGTLDSTVATKIRLAHEFSAQPASAGNRRLVFRFLVSPVEVTGDDHVDAMRCVRNEYVRDGADQIMATDDEFEIECGMLLRAIGYRGIPVTGLPFDDARGVEPNQAGRVQESTDGPVVRGVYVTGWITRGATGGIGRNRMCGQETTEAVLVDFVAATSPNPSILGPTSPTSSRRGHIEST